MMHYKIISLQIGSGTIGKVYQIEQTQPPKEKLTVKIYDENDEEHYKKEKEILTELASNKHHYNNYIIKIKNIDIIIDLLPANSRFLVFDYLKHGNLSKYLLYMENYTEFSENYIKLIAWKLLQSLKMIHEKKIYHTRLSINNIMFDDNFNPVIIHFSEAYKINGNGDIKDFKKDFIGLCKILGTLGSSGKFKDLTINSKKKVYEIKDNANNNHPVEQFWIYFQNKISTDFVRFFELLLYLKKFKNIDDLLDNVWLSDLKNEETRDNIEKNLKKYLEERYQNLIYLEQYEAIQNIDIQSVINSQNENKNENDMMSIFNNCDSRSESIEGINIFNLEIKKIENKPLGVVLDYIQFTINNNNGSDTSNVCYILMNKLINIVKNLQNKKTEIDIDKRYLCFTLILEEENTNGVECGDDNSKGEESNEEDECENLMIKIEIMQFINKGDNDIFKEQYYIMFNYIQGEIFDYYHYLKILKEKVKLLLKAT